MNQNILKNLIRDNATDTVLNAFPEARLVNDKPYTFVVPVTIEDTTYWARIGVTSCQFVDNNAHKAFNAEQDSVPARPAIDEMRRVRDAALADNREQRIAKLEAELDRLKKG